MRSSFIALILAALAAAAPPTAADTARAIREAGLDPDACYRVRDLRYFKDDIKLYFNEGYLIFSRPVLGERLTAVFAGEVEGGDGELLLLPPTRAERQALAKYTKSPNLDEHFRAALLVFTDGTGKALLDQIANGAGHPVPEMAPMLTEEWGSVIANVTEGFTIRLLQDVMSPAPIGGGFFLAAMAGKQLGNFDVIYDPRMPEQIVVAQLSERNNRPAYDIWTSFAARATRTAPSLDQRKQRAPFGFVADQYRIDASLDASLRMKAVTRARLEIAKDAPVRLFSVEVSRAMEITAVRVDGAPAEFLFRDSERGSALRPGENDIFLVIAPDTLAAGSTHEIEFVHEGNVIASKGKGVYYVGARANWYPSLGDSSATFDLTFRYPKNLTLVTPGDVIEDRMEADYRVTHRRTPRIRMAGFNLGEYEKVSSDAPGLAVDVYGNRNLEPSLVPQPRTTILIPPRGTGRGRPEAPTTIIQTPPTPDPLARLRTVASDVSAALQFYSGFMGAPPLGNLTVSPIPDTFGQGFPGLIYISTLAYLNADERPDAMRGARAQVFFSDIIQAHEVAHQWWGNLIAPESYQDEWLMEALAQYSALLWLEKKKGAKALEDVLEDYRADLVKPDSEGRFIESAGPLTWGYRLDSAPMSEAYRVITYEKGAWALHMLRRRIGDDRFLKLLGEARKRYEFRTISTREFQDLAKEFLPPKTSPDVIDSFFENWIYSTGMPNLKLKNAQKGVIPSIRVTGSIEQSGVDDDFTAEVPVEIQFAKSPAQVIWVRTSNEPVSFAATVKELPLRVTIGKQAILSAKK